MVRAVPTSRHSATLCPSSARPSVRTTGTGWRDVIDVCAHPGHHLVGVRAPPVEEPHAVGPGSVQLGRNPVERNPSDCPEDNVARLNSHRPSASSQGGRRCVDHSLTG
jgi:hypothetical protein